MEFDDLKLKTKTWFIDIDGTILFHNGYKNSKETVLDGILDFFKSIPDEDVIILTTSRNSSFKKLTEEFLKDQKIKFNIILYDLPMGIRILINDKKPDGTKTAYCENVDRNIGNLNYNKIINQ